MLHTAHSSSEGHQGFGGIQHKFSHAMLHNAHHSSEGNSVLAGPKGDRAKMEALWPHFNIRMGCELGRGFMLICSITLANAAVSPIILPFALWYFIASWIMWRYVILYVFERSSESGGMVRCPCSASSLLIVSTARSWCLLGCQGCQVRMQCTFSKLPGLELVWKV